MWTLTVREHCESQWLKVCLVAPATAWKLGASWGFLIWAIFCFSHQTRSPCGLLYFPSGPSSGSVQKTTLYLGSLHHLGSGISKDLGSTQELSRVLQIALPLSIGLDGIDQV